MMNKVCIIGRITKDIELRSTSNGSEYCRFTVAVNRSVANQDGSRGADFISCIAWKGKAVNLMTYCGKGALIGIEGRIQTGSYDTQEGHRVYTTDVVVDQLTFLEKQGEKRQQPTTYPQEYNSYDSSYGEPVDVSDEDLPF